MWAQREDYEVFARPKPDEPLRHIGSVRAASPKDAQVFAYTMYDEWRWHEMFVVPRRRIIWVVTPP